MDPQYSKVPSPLSFNVYENPDIKVQAWGNEKEDSDKPGTSAVYFMEEGARTAFGVEKSVSTDSLIAWLGGEIVYTHVWTEKESEYRGQKSSAKQKEKKIYQWTRYGEFIQEYNSEKEAAKITGIDYKAINQALNRGKHTSGNFVWSFEKVFPNKLLWQCDMQGNKIKCFIDSGDASRQLNFDASSIRKVIRGEKSYYKNFKWIED